MTATTYTVTIVCSSETVTALQAEGSALIGFSAVQGTDFSALPVVWLATNAYSQSTAIVWSASYEAYTSSSQVNAGTLLQVGTTQPVAVGQLCTVSAGGLIEVSNAGTAGYITIANGTSTQFTCGIEQPVNGTYAPVCAYPLYGLNTQTIVPLPEIVLMFTTAPLVAGEMWSDDIAPPAALQRAALDASGPALLIDMSAQITATVNYDVNDGWSWAGDGSWAQTISESMIVPATIQPTPPPTLVAAPRRTQKRRT
jgi:hypothetical protein